MSVELQSPLGVLAEWIRATDSHARHRLLLLARAQRIVDGAEDAADEERHELAARLERWRYQHLEEHRGRPTPLTRRLADVLDLALNQLLGGPARPPRRPRDAVFDTLRHSDELARAVAALDPSVPLEELARQAAELTREHFRLSSGGTSGLSTRASCYTGGQAASATQGGLAASATRRMLLYAPLYLSSHCTNHCVYCGFRYPHAIERRHLTVAEALRQADILCGRGLRHILLVAGDFPRLTGPQYFVSIIRALAERGVQVAVEIAPQSRAAYAEMAAAGACGVTLYQETYNEGLYALYHPRGSKAWYDWRLEGLERAAESGMRRLGLGILLGLADPCEDLLAMLRHARYLQTRFPQQTLAFSLPRVHDAPAGFEPPFPVDDETFVRLYCALRLGFPQAELVLSTREAAELRNRLAAICITQMSAGSSTVPGGYEDGGAEHTSGGQFTVHDQRSPAAVAAWLREAGFEVL